MLYVRIISIPVLIISLLYICCDLTPIGIYRNIKANDKGGYPNTFVPMEKMDTGGMPWEKLNEKDEFWVATRKSRLRSFAVRAGRHELESEAVILNYPISIQDCSWRFGSGDSRIKSDTMYILSKGEIVHRTSIYYDEHLDVLYLNGIKYERKKYSDELTPVPAPWRQRQGSSAP